MRKWDGIFRRLVEEEFKKLDIDIRYVDDVLIAILWKRESGWSREDLEKFVMEKMRQIVDSVNNMLKFTVDYPSAHPSGWMPVLDTQVRVRYNQVEYLYFEKPCRVNLLRSVPHLTP